MALGFIGGFWAVCGTLIIKRSWRHAYFGLVEETKEKLLMVIAVHMARVRRKIARQMLEDTNVPQREVRVLIFYFNFAFFFLFDKMFMSDLKVLTRCSYGMVSMHHIEAL